MGRELTTRDDGSIWVYETESSLFMRVSVPFSNMAELEAALVKGKLDPDLLRKLITTGHVPSGMQTAQGAYVNCSGAIDNALRAAGCLDNSGHVDCLNPGSLEETGSVRMWECHER